MMRNWQLTGADPLALRLAVDVRQFHSDYADDQIWELVLGEGQNPALALQTRYGGRCGLARLVPMFIVDGQVIYEAASYISAPVLNTFYPSYLRLSSQPAPGIKVQSEYWAMGSHAVGGRFVLHNAGKKSAEVGVDLFAQIMTAERPGEVNLLDLNTGRQALHLKNVGNLQPVVMIEPSNADAGSSPKVSARISLGPGEKQEIRWVHAGRTTVDESLALAHHWLHSEDWAPHLQMVRQINASTPVIETGDRARDAAIAFSYKVALGSVIGPTDSLPHPSVVIARIPARGFSPRGDGSDHYWQWAGLTAADAYLMLPALSVVAPDLAKGVIFNFLAGAGPDGFIDWRPGPVGQRDGRLSMPLLASTTWLVHTYNEDDEFLKDVFTPLVRFFERWFTPDNDRDGDGLPEWVDAGQSAFVGHPVFVPYSRWSQNADISKAETPDLAAYLIREGRSLLAIADILGQKKVVPRIEKRIAVLQRHLDAMWNDETGSFHHRERDSHVAVTGGLLDEGPGESALIPSVVLNPPNRVIARAMGGRDHRPIFSVTIEGLDADGKPVVEEMGGDDFEWYRSMGAATSQTVFSRLDRVTAEGLSRVYRIQVSSVDWMHEDQTMLLPLWAGLDDAVRAARIIETLTDPDRYWRPFGIPRCSAQDEAYDPTNRNGSGGVETLWNSILGEGLIDAGRADLAADLFDRLLKTQTRLLVENKGFRASHNSDEFEGIGDVDALSGIVPLHLLWRLMGFRIISPHRVMIGGEYALPWPVRVTHLGVTVERTSKGSRITFPSGKQKRVRSAKWRAVVDESAPEVKTEPGTQPAASPAPEPAAPDKPVRIPITTDDGDSD